MSPAILAGDKYSYDEWAQSKVKLCLNRARFHNVCGVGPSKRQGPIPLFFWKGPQNPLAFSSPAGDKVGRPFLLARRVKFFRAAVDFFNNFQFSGSVR